MQPLNYTPEMDAEFKESERRAKISDSLKKYHANKKKKAKEKNE